MDASDLTVFAAVAREGGFTRAARVLNTVQSNVTQRIRQLETELDVKLFDRHSRGVTLTSAGAQLLPYAERIGKLLVEAKQAAADGPEPRGRIAIGALETATAVRLPSVLAGYAASYPDVDIEYTTGTSTALVDAVLARQIDGAFVAGPIDQPDLTIVPMLQEELVLVTAPWVTDLDSLSRSRRLKVIVFRQGCTYRQRLEALLASHDIVDARRLELGTLDGIIGCVAAGVGVTLLPRAVVAKADAEKRVRLHALPRGEGRVDTVFVHRNDAFVSTALRRFIEMAKAQLALVPRDGRAATPKRRAA